MYSTNKNSLLSLAVIFLLAGTLFVGCKGDDDAEPDGTDEELITTLKMIFSQGTETLTYTFSDPDGDGGNAPTVDTVVLKAGATYTFDVQVSDESKNPAEDITEEITDEKDEHLFIYTVNGANLTMTIVDQDSNGQPVGLSGAAVTGATGTGTLNVVLKHEPDKTAADPGATGETDIEVTFAVRVE
ncbi:MAG: hypothetical protein AAFV95_01480 [Bacteroidota bacterium]